MSEDTAENNTTEIDNDEYEDENHVPIWRCDPPDQTGRKSKFYSKLGDKWLVDEIIRNLVAGASRKQACAAVKINEDTFYKWTREFSEFSESVLSGEQQFLFNGVLTINVAASPKKDAGGRVIKDGDWRAMAWLLSKRAPEEFGDNVKPKVEDSRLKSRDTAESKSMLKALDALEASNKSRNEELAQLKEFYGIDLSSMTRNYPPS